MNLIYTSVGNFQTLESQDFVREARWRRHIVEVLPMERITSYLRFETGSALAQIDAVVCAADTDLIAFSPIDHHPELQFPLAKALRLANDGSGQRLREISRRFP